LAEPVDPELEVAPVGAEAAAPVEAYGKRERPRAEVAAEAEELAQVVEGQVAEAERVAAAKALELGVLAEARVEGVGERVSAARAADPVVVELADRAAPEGVPAAVGEVAEGVGERVSAARAADSVVVELADLEGVPTAVGEVAEGLVVNLEAGAPDQVEEAQADQVEEAQADRVEALAAEVRVAVEVQLAVEAQQPSLVNG
jgi:hypothetical protein